MSDNTPKIEMSAAFLRKFLEAVTFIEYRLRDVEDSVEIIHGLLEAICDFYQADRAYVLEADWELGTGSNTYEYCAEGVETQIDVVQQIPMEIMPHWKNVLLSNQPMIIRDVEEIREQYPDEYAILTKQGVHSVLATPFSKRISTGYLGVDNPHVYVDNPSFLLVLTYAIVAELNEIKLEKSIDTVTKHTTSQRRDQDVHINCFSGLEIIGSRGSLTDDDIPSDQGVCLLGYLVLNSQRAPSIRELTGVLWPNEVVDNPYHDIKNVVYRLKRSLGLIGLDDLIIAQGGTFILNPKYVIHTDFDRFEDACNRIVNETNPEAKSALYHGARALYKGALLPRLDGAHWLIPRCTYYHNLSLRLYKGYIEHKFEMHDYAAAQKAVIEAMVTDPYDTELMVGMAISMCEQGNRSLAYSYFNSIKEHLTQEQIDMLMDHCKKAK